MRKVLALSFAAAGFYLNAQSIGNSPYAAYGLGDVKYDNSVETHSMGGISTAYIPDFNYTFNFANPAANANFQLTAIKAEAANENNYFRTNYNDTKATKHSTYLSNISLAFPISKNIKFGIGYQPYSSKKYEIINYATTASGAIEAKKFSGDGSVNLLQTAVSVAATPELSFGLRMNYNFGKVTDRQEISYDTADLVNGYETTHNVKNFNFTLGSVYQKKTSENHKFTLGATYTFGNAGTSAYNYTNSTYYYTTGDIKNAEDVLEHESNKEKNLIPMKFSLGAGYGETAKWFASAQIDYTKGENIQNMGSVTTYKNGFRVAAGGWWLPNYNNFRNYFDRIIYRAGTYYDKGTLQIGGTNINEVGISAGVFLPFQNASVNRMTGIDLGVDFGKRGTLENNLIRQNFVNLKIGINFADKWFNKTLYD